VPCLGKGLRRRPWSTLRNSPLLPRSRSRETGKIRLSYAGGLNERVEPLLDGRVTIEGIEVVPTRSHPSETFWRQLNFGHFEFFEMSISSFLIARDQGHDVVAIPAFPSRMMMHTSLHYHVDSGIDGAASLTGRRLGVGEYQQTMAVWIRGVLEHDFGVSQYDIEWYMERSEELSHGGATGFSPPPGIRFHRVPKDRTLIDMLVAREIDVASVRWGEPSRYPLGPLAWNFVDRATLRTPPAGDRSRVVPLFPDRMAEAKRFVDKHGYVPANHCFAVRSDVHERYPWAAFNLYRALIDAKTVARRDLAASIPSALFFGEDYLAQTRAICGDDPFPYGVDANRPMLEFMTLMSYQQGLIKTRPDVDDLFLPEFRQL
jgi:4,5-dihydroxyphthalate decarboxylase